MKKMKVISGAFLVLIACAAPHGASAQAATEYGLASGSSATSISGVGKNLNQRLDLNRTANMHSQSATVHRSQPSSSKPRSTNASSGLKTGSGRSPKQATAAGSPVAKEVPPGGFVIVGAEHPSGGASAATRPVGSSQSGLTVVGMEPQ